MNTNRRGDSLAPNDPSAEFPDIARRRLSQALAGAVTGFGMLGTVAYTHPLPSSYAPRGKAPARQTIALYADRIAEPLRLSMVGLRVLSDDPLLAATLSHMAPIGPNYVCIGINFDDPISSPSPYSLAVDWSVDFKSAANVPTAWLKDLESQLTSQDYTCIVQACGAPPQYAQEEPTVKPAEHPAPTQMPGYQAWVSSYFQDSAHPRGTMVVLNNEPGHSLLDFDITKDSKGNVIYPDETRAEYVIRRRISREAAANVHAEMLRGIASEVGRYGRYGLGSLLSADSFLSQGRGMTDGQRTFFEGAVDAYEWASLPLPATFLAYNSFNGKFENDIFGRWGQKGTSLGIPAVFTQMAVARMKIPEDVRTGAAIPASDVSVLGAACDMLTDLERLSHLPCEASCRSYWMIGRYAFLVKGSNNALTRSAMWHALQMFCSVPPRRMEVHGDMPTAPERTSLGAHVIAGLGGGVARALIWNDSASPVEYSMNIAGLPPVYSNATTRVLTLSTGDSAPREAGTWPGVWTLPAESVMLIEWSTPAAVDPTQRRKPLGNACRTLKASMEVHNQRGGWGKWDAVRGLAQIYVLDSARVHSVATLEGLPAILYLTSFVDGAKAGRLLIRVSFNGGQSFRTAFERSAMQTGPATTESIDLRTLGGSVWWSGARSAIIDVMLADTGTGSKANIWFSETAADAIAMAT
jgi:hypothetical protein